MTAFYGDFNRAEHEEKSLQTIAKSLELGLNMFDTAWIYQSFGVDGQENTTNEELLAKAIKYDLNHFSSCVHVVYAESTSHQLLVVIERNFPICSS